VVELLELGLDFAISPKIHHIRDDQWQRYVGTCEKALERLSQNLITSIVVRYCNPPYITKLLGSLKRRKPQPSGYQTILCDLKELCDTTIQKAPKVRSITDSNLRALSYLQNNPDLVIKRRTRAHQLPSCRKTSTPKKERFTYLTQKTYERLDTDHTTRSSAAINVQLKKARNTNHLLLTYTKP